MKATINFFIISNFRSSFQYKITTAKIAPSWIIISKLFKNSVCVSFKISEAKIKCAVEEIGKNSVMPSTIPKIIASKKFNIKLFNIYIITQKLNLKNCPNLVGTVLFFYIFGTFSSCAISQGKPNLFRSSIKGSGSKFSTFITPLPFHFSVKIIFAPIMAGTPVV